MPHPYSTLPRLFPHSTVLVAMKYLRIWDLLGDHHLNAQPDKFVWKWSLSRESIRLRLTMLSSWFVQLF
jgi:hypothetical protein